MRGEATLRHEPASLPAPPVVLSVIDGEIAYHHYLITHFTLILRGWRGGEALLVFVVYAHAPDREAAWSSIFVM